MLVLAIIALEVPLVISLRDRVDNEVRSEARTQAAFIAATADPSDRRKLDEVVKVGADRMRGRVIVVGPNGRLLSDSAGDDRIGIDYRTSRPEIVAALDGRVYQERRPSETLGQEILATAVPISNGDRVAGAVRITQSVQAVGRATRRATLGLIAIGLLVLVLGLLAGAVIARQVAGPVHRLDDAVGRFAGGDLSARAKVEGSAEQQRLARTFNDMTGRIERLVASQREFIADASHQLRTPLSGLRLRLEEARAATRDPDAHAEIDAGLAELDRLSAIISELLVLSQAGEVDAPPEQVDLEDAAHRAAARWDGTGGGRVRADGVAAEGFCPLADLDRVLDALVENGLNYGNGEVMLRSAPGVVEVLDRGPGLAPDEVAAVFERFHRGRAGRSGPAGTGLGLPIARELARRWGGEVTLDNRSDGAGALAVVTVPAVAEP
ncbi:MAG TPA: HAMP domain-containing sensor histidine kinase [Solirubrobacteraceae bacterium]|nr:HAMP domain-containing sensor histidine kinase [Solirubrobacteraceae bacterium]